MKLIYNKVTGSIISAISVSQDFKVYYSEFGDDFINELAEYEVESLPTPLSNYYIFNGEILKYGESEMNEIELYNRILSDEERVLNKLKPTYDEIKKAEQTIEILSLLEEVL